MNAIQKIIIKHYSEKSKKYKTRGWEQCGIEIQSLIRKKEDEIRAKILSYSDQCNKIDHIRFSIENEYEKYFSFTNYSGIVAGYDWVHGNNKLKQLLNNN